MDNTISAILLRSALALVLAALIAVTAFAVQDDIPRTASGMPDLSGFYDVATLTPLSRPARFGDNLFLTEEQARAIEEEELAFLAKANEQSDPNRAAPSDDGAAPVGFEDSQREDLGAGNVGGYHVAYAVFRRYQAGDAQYFDRIASKFDAEDGVVHGLAHKELGNAGCMCPACLSRRINEGRRS